MESKKASYLAGYLDGEGCEEGRPMEPTVDDTTVFQQTYTGRRVDPLYLHDGDVCAVDIAHALSLICRWGGHSKMFYSVAQHSINVASTVRPQNRLAALLHDATEAYMGDVVRPIKLLMPEYTSREVMNRQVIFKAFNVKDYCWSDVLAEDDRWLTSEAHILIAGSKEGWREQPFIGYSADRSLHEPQDPAQVEAHFLDTLTRLQGRWV